MCRDVAGIPMYEVCIRAGDYPNPTSQHALGNALKNNGCQEGPAGYGDRQAG